MALTYGRKFRLFQTVVSTIILISGSRASGTAIPRFNLEELVSSSELIAVGQVGPTKTVRVGVVRFPAETVPSQVFSVDVSVLRLVKGECASEITATYSIPSGRTSGYHAIGTGTRIVFLRRDGRELTVTNPYYPSLPASAATPGASDANPAARVVDELGAVLASETELASSKQQVLDVAYGLPPNELFTASLRRALDTDDLDLRYRVMANLIRRHDLTVLPRATELLLTPDFPESYRSMLDYAIGTSVTDPVSVPLLSRLVHSGYAPTRAAIMQAFWHIGTRSVIPFATKALADPDLKTRYYAVRALADATGQLEWGPSIPEFEENGSKYIQHWLEWSKVQPQ